MWLPWFPASARMSRVYRPTTKPSIECTNRIYTVYGTHACTPSKCKEHFPLAKTAISSFLFLCRGWETKVIIKKTSLLTYSELKKLLPYSGNETNKIIYIRIFLMFQYLFLSLYTPDAKAKQICNQWSEISRKMDFWHI